RNIAGTSTQARAAALARDGRAVAAVAALASKALRQDTVERIAASRDTGVFTLQMHGNVVAYSAPASGAFLRGALTTLAAPAQGGDARPLAGECAAQVHRDGTAGIDHGRAAEASTAPGVAVIVGLPAFSGAAD